MRAGNKSHLCNKVTLKEAVRFHGHLGPYLILGVKAGELALKKLGCKKYFGLEVKVRGASKKPKSCLIDGLQLSTGATFGKGNIEKSSGQKIKVQFKNRNNHKAMGLRLKDGLMKRLEEAKTHRDAETLAKELYKKHYAELFNLEGVG